MRSVQIIVLPLNYARMLTEVSIDVVKSCVHTKQSHDDGNY